MATSSLMLSMEMRDIDPDLSPKASSVRDYLPKDFT
jgi:5-carboxymethyl-2-hydroxymuconate isomerase